VVVPCIVTSIEDKKKIENQQSAFVQDCKHVKFCLQEPPLLAPFHAFSVHPNIIFFAMFLMISLLSVTFHCFSFVFQCFSFDFILLFLAGQHYRPIHFMTSNLVACCHPDVWSFLPERLNLKGQK